METITADQIKPAVKGQSDFFSWQLYRWLKKYPERTKIFTGTWNFTTGHDTERQTLYIGYRDEGWFYGKPLRNLCLHGADLQAFAFGPAHHVEEWEDSTEPFWRDYFRIGVCAIHGDYAHKWLVKGKKRTCEYCEKVEHKKHRIIKKEYWEAA